MGEREIQREIERKEGIARAHARETGRHITNTLANFHIHTLTRCSKYS